MNDYDFVESLGAHHPITVSLTVAEAEQRERRGLPLPISGDAESDHAKELLRIRQERKAKMAAEAPAVKTGAAPRAAAPTECLLCRVGGVILSGHVDAACDEHADLLNLISPSDRKRIILVKKGDELSVVVEGNVTGRTDIDHHCPCVRPIQLFPASGLEKHILALHKAGQDYALVDANAVVVGIERERIDLHVSHRTSPSVGAPNGAVCDNPKPTEGDAHQGGLPSNKAGHLL